MPLILFHLIFVTLLLDDYVHPDVLKSTNRSSIMSIAIHIVLVIYDSFNQHHTCCRIISISIWQTLPSSPPPRWCRPAWCAWCTMLSILKSSKTSKPSMSQSSNNPHLDKYQVKWIWSFLIISSLIWWTAILIQSNTSCTHLAKVGLLRGNRRWSEQEILQCTRTGDHTV